MLDLDAYYCAEDTCPKSAEKSSVKQPAGSPRVITHCGHDECLELSYCSRRCHAVYHGKSGAVLKSFIAPFACETCNKQFKETDMTEPIIGCNCLEHNKSKVPKKKFCSVDCQTQHQVGGSAAAAAAAAAK
jgi:hypothetical protein